ncbi:MAG: prepilin-type N-terminal cleavage/methylation domain-containing protein [Candidatus Accumulibacter necessarius]|jgi:type II secretory pathway component PulJ|uniref:PilW family protein n=1 Tax=Candidatus Accumulibacter necessarius TaxID=2954386 RepID=UPI002FC3D2BE
MDKRISLRKSDLGFSLVELLVATAITLISLLIIVQVFSVYDGWKRTTTGTAQSQENGLLAAFSIERDLRSAGFGMVGLGCSTINAYNAGLVAPSPSAQPDFRSPSRRTRRQLALTGSISSTVHRLSAIFTARLQADMPDSDRAPRRVNNGVGFNQGDMILISEPPKDCSILQLSQDAQATACRVTGAPHGICRMTRCLSMEYATTRRTFLFPCTRLQRRRRRRPGSQSRPVGRPQLLCAEQHAAHGREKPGRWHPDNL